MARHLMLVDNHNLNFFSGLLKTSPSILDPINSTNNY